MEGCCCIGCSCTGDVFVSPPSDVEFGLSSDTDIESEVEPSIDDPDPVPEPEDPLKPDPSGSPPPSRSFVGVLKGVVSNPNECIGSGSGSGSGRGTEVVVEFSLA